MSKTKRNLHILIIPSWYPRFDGDISGSFFREQALALQSAGHQVGVIYPQLYSLKQVHKIPISTYGVEHKNDRGLATLKWHTLNFTPGLSNLTKKQWINKGLSLFKEYKKKFGMPDIIHVHSLKPAGYLAFEIKARYDIPFIVTEHSTAFARGLVDPKEIMKLNKVVEASSYNIAVSQPFSSLLIKTFKHSKWHYIPNIVNDDFLSADNTSSSNKFIFLSVSLLTEKKAIDNLIKAFSIVSKVLPNTLLHIGGDGPDKIKLQNLVSSLQLDDKVKFLGNLTREEVKTEMSKCSVFVLPSRFETFGVVAIEALAVGRPVIATKCGGPESIVNKDVGLLIAVDDINTLSHAMIQIYSEYKNYDPEHIKQYCVSNFSEKAVTNALNRVYNTVLAS